MNLPPKAWEHDKVRIQQRKWWLSYEALAMLSAWDKDNQSNLTEEDGRLLSEMCEQAHAKMKTPNAPQIKGTGTRAGQDVSNE